MAGLGSQLHGVTAQMKTLVDRWLMQSTVSFDGSTVAAATGGSNSDV
jgi:hypothetical protein